MSEWIVKQNQDGQLEVVGELIRCKDCEHRKVYEMKGNTLALCNRLKTTMADAVEDNDYCSRAERKEE